MSEQEPVVLVIEWDEGVNLPRVVGPFKDKREAGEWGRLNVPNGTWEMHLLSYPYMRVRGRDMTLAHQASPPAVPADGAGGERS